MTHLHSYTCLRCGHTWWPRKPGRPRVCPTCKNPWWDKPKPVPRNTVELAALLRRFGDRLPKRTRAIAEARAMGNGARESLRALGARYGISGAYVHQIVSTALKALRRAAAGE